MPYRIRVLAFAALTAACQPGSQDVSAVSQGVPSSAMQLNVQLLVLSENPTPAGLPVSLVIATPRLPRVGERVAVTWRAVDGDAGPREGSGYLEIDPQDNRLVATLTAPGRASTEVLTLSGTATGGTLSGTFSDRLFFRRAGRFEGQIREQ
jgi:hypothetical protein